MAFTHELFTQYLIEHPEDAKGNIEDGMQKDVTHRWLQWMVKSGHNSQRAHDNARKRLAEWEEEEELMREHELFTRYLGEEEYKLTEEERLLFDKYVNNKEEAMDEHELFLGENEETPCEDLQELLERTDVGSMARAIDHVLREGIWYCEASDEWYENGFPALSDLRIWRLVERHLYELYHESDPQTVDAVMRILKALRLVLPA